MLPEPQPGDPKPAPLKPAITTGDIPAEAAPDDPSKLTPEQQMEKYEEELRHSDWGHQPC
jgi:hypothetical protein